MASDDLVVCLGFPPFHKEEYLERLRALPKVAPVIPVSYTHLTLPTKRIV